MQEEQLENHTRPAITNNLTIVLTNGTGDTRTRHDQYSNFRYRGYKDGTNIRGGGPWHHLIIP